MSRVDLSGKAIIITGASAGIGEATARACAKAGMNLVLSARRMDRLEALAEEINNWLQKDVCALVAGDVTEPGINERMMDAAHERFEGFHAVFANAGYALTLPVIDESEEQTRRMFDVNFFASIELCKAAARRLLEHGRRGHLIMCSSSISRFALPDHGTYAATKAAQHQVCAAMRHELWEDGVYVSSVHPITTKTEFFEVAAEQSGRPRPIGGVPGHTPKFMLQSAETVADAVVKCLKKPRPEVWTSALVRTVAGVMTVSPRFYDFIMRRQVVPKDAAAKEGGGSGPAS